MKKLVCARGISLFLLALIATPLLAETETLRIEALKEPVEILIDNWGIAHIYAANESDLFFAQGFNAARDRLFQLEMWRRQATGTVAAILGRKLVQVSSMNPATSATMRPPSQFAG